MSHDKHPCTPSCKSGMRCQEISALRLPYGVCSPEGAKVLTESRLTWRRGLRTLACPKNDDTPNGLTVRPSSV